MKKVFLFLFLINGYCSLAQSFVSVKAAYAFGRNESISVLRQEEGISVEEFTIADGFTPEISWIFCFSENFGFTLDASFLLGRKIDLTGEIYEVDQMPQAYYMADANGMIPTSSDPLISAFSAQTQRLYLSPNLLISTGGDGFSFYSKIGLAIPVYHQLELSYTHQDLVLAKEVNTSLELASTFGIGFKAALGANLDLNDYLGLFFEVDYLGLQLKAKTAEVTQYEIAGKDELASLGAAKTIKYGTSISSNPPSVQQERQALTFPLVYNNLGIGLGIRIRIKP